MDRKKRKISSHSLFFGSGASINWNSQEGPQKDLMESLEPGGDFVFYGAGAGGGGCNKLFSGMAGGGKTK